MLKNKKVVSVVGIALAVTLLATTAFANINNASGYEAFKQSVISSIKLGNCTIDAQISIKDNGQEIDSEHGITKMTENGMSSKSFDSTGGVPREGENYLQDGQYIYRDSETGRLRAYSSLPGANDHFKPSDVQIRFAEAFVDLMAGDAKNYFVTDGNHVSLQLQQGQIPQIIQLGLSAVAEVNSRSTDGEVFGHGGDNSPLAGLVNEFAMQSVSIDGTIGEDGYVKDTKAVVILTGIDATGTHHEVEVNINVALSDIGTTVPDRVDTTNVTPENIMFEPQIVH